LRWVRDVLIMKEFSLPSSDFSFNFIHCRNFHKPGWVNDV